MLARRFLWSTSFYPLHWMDSRVYNPNLEVESMLGFGYRLTCLNGISL
jgi:hypothetical protein